MPIFEYECKKCSKTTEKIAKYDDVIACEKCGYVMNKLPPLSNFHLKGSGWAKDNYSSPKKSK